jgi:hypothetical protein
LLEHFEEAHVVVIDNAGNPVFPRTRASDDFEDFQLSSIETAPLSDQPEYPYTSLVCGYPQLDPQPVVLPNQMPLHSEPVGPLEVESPTPSAYYPLHAFLDHERVVEDADTSSELDTYSFEPDNSLSSSTPEQPVEMALPPASFGTDASYHLADHTPYEHRHRGSYKSRILATKPRPYQRRREKAHKCPVRISPTTLPNRFVYLICAHYFWCRPRCRHPAVQKYVTSYAAQLVQRFTEFLSTYSRTLTPMA